MKNFTSLFSCLFIALFSDAQDTTFSNVYHNSDGDLLAESIASTMDNGSVVIGKYIYDQSHITKLDSNGSIVWSRTYEILPDFQNIVTFNRIISTTDTCYVVVGSARNPDNNLKEAFLVKLNDLGDTLWTLALTNPGSLDLEGVSVIEANDSAYVIAGFAGNYLQSFIAKIDFDGNLEWSSTIDNSENSAAYSLQQLADSSFMMYGFRIQSGMTVEDAILSKFSASGQYEWTKSYPQHLGYDIKAAADGIILYSRSIATGNISLMKTDFDGNIIWNKEYNNQTYNFEGYLKMCQLSDSSLLIPTEDFGLGYLLMVDKNGEILQSKLLEMRSRDLTETKNKGVFIAGFGPLLGLKMLLPNAHFGVIKTDSLLNSTECIGDNFSSLTTGSVTPATEFFTSVSNISSHFLPVIIDSLDVSIYSGCVDHYGGIDENDNEISLTVYPNASSGVFYFDKSKQENLQLEIYNSLGQLILQKNLSSLSNRIDLGDQPQGIYFYHASNPQKRVSGKMVVID